MTKVRDVTCTRCGLPGLYWDVEMGGVIHTERPDGQPLTGCYTRLPESDPQPAHSDLCSEHLRCIAHRRGLA